MGQTVSTAWPFPWPQTAIAHSTAYRTNTPPQIDGCLDEACWQRAPRSPRFADLINGQPGLHDTRAAVLWDGDCLYVGYWIEDPFVEANLTERDALIYGNNDVELFVAGPDAYYELEILGFTHSRTLYRCHVFNPSWIAILCRITSSI